MGPSDVAPWNGECGALNRINTKAGGQLHHAIARPALKETIEIWGRSVENVECGMWNVGCENVEWWM